MSRNASGTYTLPAGNPVVTATVISSAWANTTLSDIATEMTDSLDRSGKGAMLAGLPLSDGVIGAPGLTFGSELTMGFWRTGAAALAFVSGGVNRMTVSATSVWSFWEGTNNVGTAGLFQVATEESGSFTGTLTGCTTAPTASRPTCPGA